jgi:hypothetical protein
VGLIRSARDVSGFSLGAELRLSTLPCVAAPALVDAGFDLVSFETPDTIARVVTNPIPEPRSTALLLLGGVIVAFAVARSARA